MPTWRNWAGDQRCRPQAIERPTSLDELRETVARASGAGRRIRVSASGHSFTDIALTDGIMLRLERLNRILDFDAASGLVRVEAGATLRDLNRRLDELGVAFENLGDIDRQSVAGAISTSTHGTGARFRSIAAQLESVELVLADGSVVALDPQSDLEGFAAAQVGLGSLGVVHAVTIQAVPAFTLNRVDRPRPLEETLDDLDSLVDEYDHFEFYVFPHTRTAICRESRRTDERPQPRSAAHLWWNEIVLENGVGQLFTVAARRAPSLIPRLTRFASEQVGHSVKIDRSHRVFPSERRIRFTEMEYAVPRERALDVIPRVLEIVNRPELRVSFPIEVRFAAADGPFLSTSHGRDTAYVAVHHDRKQPELWRRYFEAVEAIMREHVGRPHWGKRHFQTAETLAPLYPRWDDFAKVRARLDPRGTFANDYTDRVLGPVAR
jgi:L-gulono-1,4-lactone dehydrogenase